MGVLAKNVEFIEGVQLLNNVLECDYDGSILNDVIGMFSGQQVQNFSMFNGFGILKYVLGNKQGGVVQMISQFSGLDFDKIGSLMMMFVLVVMGVLGKIKWEQGLDMAGIVFLFFGMVFVEWVNINNLVIDMVMKFLDSDGDGSVVDDVVSIGMKMLGGLFGRK